MAKAKSKTPSEIISVAYLGSEVGLDEMFDSMTLAEFGKKTTVNELIVAFADAFYNIENDIVTRSNFDDDLCIDLKNGENVLNKNENEI